MIRYKCWSCRAVVVMNGCGSVRGLRPHPCRQLGNNSTLVMERLSFWIDLNEKVLSWVTAYLFWSFLYLKGLILCSFSGLCYHFWVSTRTFMSKTFFFHTSLCCSISIHLLSYCFVSVSVSLRPPFWKDSSDLFLAGLSREPPYTPQPPAAVFLHQLCVFLQP